MGGTLRIGVARLASLDPAEASPVSPSAAIVADLLFDGLTVVRTGSDAAEPRLAESWVTPDSGRTWQFTLDATARFSNGRLVTAADVEFSLERVAAKGPSSLAAARLDGLTGFAPFVTGATTDLAGIRAVDEQTVELVFDRAEGAVAELLAAPAFGIVPRESVETSTPSFAEAPAFGSGPFSLAGRDGDVLHLVRVTEGAALLDGVDVHLFDDLSVAYDAFVDGELDWALLPPGRADEAAETFGADGFVPFQAEQFFAFNLASPTFADVRFRRAIAHAIDRDAIVNAVLFARAEPLTTIVPPGVPGAAEDGDRCGEACAFLPDQARALLAEAFPAGGPAVPEVFLDFDDGVDEAAIAGIVEQNLEAVGIPVTLRPKPPQEYEQFLVSGQQQLFRLGWIGAYPSPDAYLDPLFRTGSPDNVTGFSDPAVDDLLARAAAAATVPERLDLLAQAEATILQAAPIIPLAQFRLLSVSADDVRDLVLSAAGTFAAETVWLAR